MGVYILEYIGFARHINDLLGEDHTSIEELKIHYQNRKDREKAMIPSTGIIMSLLVADMIACARNITRTYKVEEMAEIWQSAPLLGIEPSLLNDDRILRAMSKIGNDSSVMEAGEKAKIPLNKFILDTTLLQLSGEFKNAPKVVPGRGRDSFSQLIVSLVVASGSRLPVGFGVLPGNTSDSTTLPDIYRVVDRIADEGPIEFLMDRIYPTPSNIRFLLEQQDNRMVYWVSPLKMGLSEKEVRNRIDEAYETELWKQISYRSIREVSKKEDPQYTAFEGTWIIDRYGKARVERRTKETSKRLHRKSEDGSTVFYRHKIKAQNEKIRRNIRKEQLNEELQGFLLKINKRKYVELEYCKVKLNDLMKAYPDVKSFVTCNLAKADNKSIMFSWVWDDIALTKEEKYDGIFALLTNYEKQKVNTNQLVKKYRSRDQVEVDFKGMKGILDLGKIIYQVPERIDAYVFLKVISYFVLAFLRSYVEKEGLKITEKQLQENMGDLLVTDVEIQPLKIRSYSVARDCAINKLLRSIFKLPNPVDLIEVLNDAESIRMEIAVKVWYENWLAKTAHTKSDSMKGGDSS